MLLNLHLIKLMAARCSFWFEYSDITVNETVVGNLGIPAVGYLVS